MFKLEEYDYSRELKSCPQCGRDENYARVLEAHPWQKWDTLGKEVIAEGEDLEVKCPCGHVYYVPGRAF